MQPEVLRWMRTHERNQGRTRENERERERNGRERISSRPCPQSPPARALPHLSPCSAVSLVLFSPLLREPLHQPFLFAFNFPSPFTDRPNTSPCCVAVR